MSDEESKKGQEQIMVAAVRVHEFHLRALRNAYPADHLTAGVVTSDLGEGARKEGRFYASVVRYPASAEDKRIVVRVFGDTLPQVLGRVAVEWAGHVVGSLSASARQEHVQQVRVAAALFEEIKEMSRGHVVEAG